MYLLDPERTTYRLRMSNIPSTVTKEELLKVFDVLPKYADRLKLPDSPISDPFMVVYLVQQPSQNLLRSKIRQLHNKTFSRGQSHPMKFQLEPNMDYFDWNNDADLPTPSRISSSSTTTTKAAPWSNGTEFQSSQTTRSPRIMRKKTQGPSDLSTRAPQWRWTGEKLFDDSEDGGEIYSLVSNENREETAIIKICKTNARREKFILEKLQGKFRFFLSSQTKICSSLGINGIPNILISNIDIQSNNDPWIIMEYINGVTLLNYVKSRSMNFRDKLIITRKLLHLIEKIHSRNIVHRYMKPDNIIVTTPHNEISLFFIDLTQAYSMESVGDDHVHLINPFYQPIQFEKESNDEHRSDLCNPSIDTTFVCAILFWLITEHHPKESKNIDEEAPHQRGKFVKIIEDEVTKATGKKKNSLHHIIDRLSSKEFGQTRRNMNLSNNIFNLYSIGDLVFRRINGLLKDSTIN